MSRFLNLVIPFLLLPVGPVLGDEGGPGDGSLLEWTEVDPIPGGVGYAGAFSGIVDGRLLVVGGANFPDGPAWSSEKAWHGTIHELRLDDIGSGWTTSGSMTLPRAYGVSATHPEHGFLLIGGSDGNRHHADIRRIGPGDTVPVDLGLPLPEPIAYATGAVVDDVLYVIGGTNEVNSVTASPRIHSIDLSGLAPGSSVVPEWNAVEPIPGSTGRMLAVTGVHAGSLYVFGGCSLAPGDDGVPVRTYLDDAWRYDPGRPAGSRWTRLSPMPRASVAAPSPAFNLGQSFLGVLGGDDGRNVNRIDELRDRHPGFTDDLLAYHVLTDNWTVRDGFPRDPGPDPAGRPGDSRLPPVTTSVIEWNGSYVIPSGEIRPRVRSARVWIATPTFDPPSFSTLDWIALCVYLGVLVIMGLYFSRRESSTEDFFLAGRRIPWWAAGVSIFATQLSAITFMAIPAKSYHTDWTYFIQSLGIFAMAPVVAYLFLPFFRRLDVTTAYEYLEHRFSVGIRLFGSSQYLLFQFGRMAIVVYLPALALSAVTGIDILFCIGIMGVLCIFYTVLGGVEAVIWSDVIQAFVLLGGAVLIIIACVSGVDGGLSELHERASAADRLRFVDLDAGWDFTRASLPVVILGGIFINLVPYASDQSVVQRYLTTRDESASRRAIWLGGILALPASILFFGIGTALFGFYDANPERLVPLEKTDQILPWFLVNEIPSGLAGLVIAGIFAAAMSSLDSSMNSSATALVTDFYRRFLPDHPESHYLGLARWITVLLGIIGTGVALLMATSDAQGIFDQWLQIVGLFGGGLCGLFVLGIFTNRAGTGGAIIGIVSSVLVLVLVRAWFGFDGLTYAAFGVVTCVTAGWLSSFLLRNRKSVRGLTLHSMSAEG